MGRGQKRNAMDPSSQNDVSPVKKAKTPRQINSERFNSLRAGDILTIVKNDSPGFHDVTGSHPELVNRKVVLMEVGTWPNTWLTLKTLDNGHVFKMRSTNLTMIPEGAPNPDESAEPAQPLAEAEAETEAPAVPPDLARALALVSVPTPAPAEPAPDPAPDEQAAPAPDPAPAPAPDEQAGQAAPGEEETSPNLKATADRPKRRLVLEDSSPKSLSKSPSTEKVPRPRRRASGAAAKAAAEAAALEKEQEQAVKGETGTSSETPTPDTSPVAVAAGRKRAPSARVKVRARTSTTPKAIKKTAGQRSRTAGSSGRKKLAGFTIDHQQISRETIARLREITATESAVGMSFGPEMRPDNADDQHSAEDIEPEALSPPTADALPEPAPVTPERDPSEKVASAASSPLVQAAAQARRELFAEEAQAKAAAEAQAKVEAQAKTAAEAEFGAQAKAAAEAGAEADTKAKDEAQGKAKARGKARTKASAANKAANAEEPSSPRDMAADTKAAAEGTRTRNRKRVAEEAFKPEDAEDENGDPQSTCRKMLKEMIPPALFEKYRNCGHNGIHVCTRRARDGSRYCGRHQKKSEFASVAKQLPDHMVLPPYQPGGRYANATTNTEIKRMQGRYKGASGPAMGGAGMYDDAEGSDGDDDVDAATVATRKRSAKPAAAVGDLPVTLVALVPLENGSYLLHPQPGQALAASAAAGHVVARVAAAGANASQPNKRSKVKVPRTKGSTKAQGNGPNAEIPCACKTCRHTFETLDLMHAHMINHHSDALADRQCDVPIHPGLMAQRSSDEDAGAALLALSGSAPNPMQMFPHCPPAYLPATPVGAVSHTSARSAEVKCADRKLTETGKWKRPSPSPPRSPESLRWICTICNMRFESPLESGIHIRTHVDTDTASSAPKEPGPAPDL
eukprot:m.91167 g.91167  ORF g.91167 m.91167 type:complete len:910 (+) comp13725_c0_seq1:273-3002(+)